MATTRYEVPPGGGFYVGIPGIWDGGDVFEIDDETGEVLVISRADEQDQEKQTPAVDESAAAKPGMGTQQAP